MSKANIFQDTNTWLFTDSSICYIIEPDTVECVMLHLYDVCGAMVLTVEKTSQSSCTVMFDCLYDLRALRTMVRDQLRTLRKKITQPIKITIGNTMGAKTIMLNYNP